MGKMRFGKHSNPVAKGEPPIFVEMPKQRSWQEEMSTLQKETIDKILSEDSELFKRLAEHEAREKQAPLATMKLDAVKEIHHVPVNKPDSKARKHSRLMRKELDKKVQELNKRLDVQQGCGCSTTVENKYDDSELKKLINELRSEVYVINQFEKNAPSVIQPPQEKQPQSKLIYVAIGLSILSILITFIK